MRGVMGAPEGFVTLGALAVRVGLSRGALAGFVERGTVRAMVSGRRRFVADAEADAFAAWFGQFTAPEAADRARGSVCVAVPGGRCPCRCHLIIRGRRESRLSNADPRTWMPAHLGVLGELVADGQSPEQIAPILSERFHVPRSVHAVRAQMRKSGLSARDGWLSGEDLIRLLGIYRRRIQQWQASGQLTAAEYGHWRRYRRAEVEQLIRAEAGLTIDPRRVSDPRLRTLAETSAIVNRRRATG